NQPRRLGIAVKVREGGLFIYIEEKGEKMREFDDFMDLTDQNKILQCRYHGLNKNLHLEGRILSETDSGLSVGVSLCEQDISSHQYDHQRYSLDLWYQAPPPNTIRTRLLVMQYFDVPKDIQEINVYDVG
ncbi:MAG: hypothetical protein AABX24_04405, partial [Nanoarchaeota archaeon]